MPLTINNKSFLIKMLIKLLSEIKQWVDGTGTQLKKKSID